MFIKILLAYIGTNADDILTNTVFFSNCKQEYERNIFIGKTLGVGLIMIICLLGAYGINLIPISNLNLLGIIPIIIGIKYLIKYEIKKITNKNEYKIKEIFLFTISNCSNNIAIIIPTFHNYSATKLSVIFIMFLILTILACYITKLISENSIVKKTLEKIGPKFVSIVLIIIGLMTIFA